MREQDLPFLFHTGSSPGHVERQQKSIQPAKEEVGLATRQETRAQDCPGPSSVWIQNREMKPAETGRDFLLSSRRVLSFTLQLASIWGSCYPCQPELWDTRQHSSRPGCSAEEIHTWRVMCQWGSCFLWCSQDCQAGSCLQAG